MDKESTSRQNEGVLSDRGGLDDGDSLRRRDFFIGLGKWSRIVIQGVLLGGVATTVPLLPSGCWLNEGTSGSSWYNRGVGWANGGIGWGNYGGGRSWANRGGWVNRGGGWINRRGGTGWANRRGPGSWANRRGGGGWANRRGGGGWANRRR